MGARAATDLAACAFFCSQALEHCRTDLARDEDVLTVQPRSLLRRLWRRMAGTAGLAPDIVLCAAVVSRTLALRVLHREHSIMQVHALAQGHRSLDASTDPTTRGSQHGGGSGSGGTEGKRGGYRCSASRQKLLSSRTSCPLLSPVRRDARGWVTRRDASSDSRGGCRRRGAQRERMERHSHGHTRRGRACGSGGRQVWPERKRHRSAGQHIVTTTPRLCIAART